MELEQYRELTSSILLGRHVCLEERLLERTSLMENSDLAYDGLGRAVRVGPGRLSFLLTFGFMHSGLCGRDLSKL